MTLTINCGKQISEIGEYFNMDSLLTLILVLVTFWVLCPTTTQATEQDAEILEDILTRYRENIRKEKNYIPGLTQPVLFEPRPQIKPTAGHYTLLLVIPRETVQNRYKELKKHMEDHIKKLRAFRCPAKIPCDFFSGIQANNRREMEVIKGQLEQEMEHFNSMVQRNFQSVNHIVRTKETSHNPYQGEMDGAGSRNRKKREIEIPEGWKRKSTPSSPDKWTRLEQLIDSVLVRQDPLHEQRPGPTRNKRFLWSLGNSLAIYRNHKRISRLNDKVNILQRNDQLLDKKIHFLGGILDQTIVAVHALADRTDQIIARQRTLATILKEEMEHIEEVKYIFYILLLGLQQTRIYRQRIEALKDLMWQYTRWMETLTTGRVTPNLVKPKELREYLNRMKKELEPIPHLSLPLDPEADIWTAYSMCTIVPYLLEDFVVVEVDVPLTSSNLDLQLYSVHNLPAVHPQTGLSATYRLEGKFFAVSTNKHFIAIPNEDEVAMCEATGNVVCNFKAPLYPRVKCRACLCALYDDILEDQTRRIMEDCPVHLANATKQQAIYLEDNYWVIVTAHSFMMYVTCPKKTYYQKVEPPLSFVNLTGGCMGQASEIFLPALTHVVTAMDLTPRTDMVEQYARLSESYEQMKVWDYLNISTKKLDDIIAFKYKELPLLPEHLSMDLINQKLETFNPQEESWWDTFKTWIIAGAVLLIIPLAGVAIYFVYCRGQRKLMCCAAKRVVSEVLAPKSSAEVETTDLDEEGSIWELSATESARHSWNAPLRTRRNSDASEASHVSRQTAFEVPLQATNKRRLSASRASIKSLATQAAAEFAPVGTEKYTEYLTDRLATQTAK